jgi:hypothetical protein
VSSIACCAKNDFRDFIYFLKAERVADKFKQGSISDLPIGSSLRPLSWLAHYFIWLVLHALLKAAYF